MIAVDTNIVLRLVLADDVRQLDRITALMLETEICVPLTVFLETGWILASHYRMKRADVADALDAVLRLQAVEVARAGSARWAVDRYRAGSDRADVVHVVASSKLQAFATCDQRLARMAGSDAPVAVMTLA